MKHVCERRRVRPARAGNEHLVSSGDQTALAYGPPHRRGDHEGTLKHARREGKPHLGSVAQAAHSRGFSALLGPPRERKARRCHAKAGTRTPKKPGSCLGRLEGALLLFCSELNLRCGLPAILPLLSHAFDRDQNGRHHTSQANGKRRNGTLLTTGLVEREISSKRAASGADDWKHRECPGIVETRHRGNDEPELGAHQAEADGALGRGAQVVESHRRSLGLSRTWRSRQQNHRRQCQSTSDSFPVQIPLRLLQGPHYTQAETAATTRGYVENHLA